MDRLVAVGASSAERIGLESRPLGNRHSPSFFAFPKRSLAGASVGPGQRKAKPRAVSGDFMVVHDETGVRPVPPCGGLPVQNQHFSLILFSSASGGSV
jgi:hypothetical protein